MDVRPLYDTVSDSGATSVRRAIEDYTIWITPAAAYEFYYAPVDKESGNWAIHIYGIVCSRGVASADLESHQPDIIISYRDAGGLLGHLECVVG